LKKYVRTANYGPYKYRYEIRTISPYTGKSVLRGASRSLINANEICIRQADAIFDNLVFDGPENTFKFLDNLYIYDAVDKKEVEMDLDTEAYIDELMSECDSRM